MEIKVFTTDDGALVLLPLDTDLSSELLRIGALELIGTGVLSSASVSLELMSLLSKGGAAIAQPRDVEPVMRAISDPLVQ